VLLAPDHGDIEACHLWIQPPGAPLDNQVDASGKVGTAAAPGADANELDALCQRVLEQNIDIASLEQRLMQTAMQRAKGNLSLAARLLGITRPQLAYRLKKEGLPAS